MGLAVLNKLVNTPTKAALTGAATGITAWELLLKPAYRYAKVKVADWFSDDQPEKAEKKNGAKKAG